MKRTVLVSLLLSTAGLSAEALSQEAMQTPRPASQTQASGQPDNTARQRAFLQRFGARGAVALTGTERRIAMRDIKKMDVWNARGEWLGEVDDVIAVNGEIHLVVAEGGFLGRGRETAPRCRPLTDVLSKLKCAALPVDRFALQTDGRLIVHGTTAEDLNSMRQLSGEPDSFRRLADNGFVRLPLLRAN
jgi:hypothetical protein